MRHSSSPTVARRSLSLRVRLLAIAGVAAAPALIGAFIGVSGMTAINDNVAGMDHHVARPLSSLGELRDMEGDSRVLIWQYLDASPADRADLRTEVTATDADLAKAAGDYLAAHGSTTDGQAKLMASFLDLHQKFMAVRDQQVFKAADNGHTARAYKLVHGRLDVANEAMGAPMDTLMQHEATSANAFRASATAAYHRVLVELVVVIALGLAAAIAFALWQSRRILRHVELVRDGLSRLARRDLSWSAPNVAGDDELSSMARDAGAATATMLGVVTELRQSAEALSRRGGSLSTVSAEVAAESDATSAQTNVVAQSASAVSSSVQSAATATEELSASIREIAVNSARAADVATSAVAEAGVATETINKLGSSSAAIRDVIKTITQIADQTNLLALNATIEAQRAGDAGRGFAVVATEVKELAKETAAATEDISRRIELMQGDTAEAIQVIASISGVIEDINGYQTTIASAVEEQTATTGAMAQSIQEAAAGTGEIADRLVTVARGAESASAGVRQAQDAADDLARLAGELERLVGQFTLPD